MISEILMFLRAREPKDNASLRRYGSILRGGASALIAKGVSALAVLISVPLTLNHLGSERYGLWATLYSLIAWLSLVDLGLTNGLMNALSEAFGEQRQDRAREYVSTAFWGLCGLAFSAGALLATASIWIDWASVFHIQSARLSMEFSLAVTVAVVVFMMSLPFTIVGKVYIAYQQGEIANAWAAATTILGLLGLALAVFLHGGLPALVLGFSGGQLLVSATSAVWLFTRSKPELSPTFYCSGASFHRVFHVAGAFFVTQIATLMLFQSANLIITRYVGPEQVAPYQVTWTLFFYITIPQQLFGANIWAAVGEAYARNDLGWIRKLFKRYLLLSLFYGIPFVLFLMIFCEDIVRFWAGLSAIPSQGLIYWMAAWAFLLVLMQPLIMILGGTGRLGVYSIFSVLMAVIAIVGARWAVIQYGTVGIIASTVISFAVLALIPAAYLTAQILRCQEENSA